MSWAKCWRKNHGGEGGGDIPNETHLTNYSQYLFGQSVNKVSTSFSGVWTADTD